MTLDEIKEFLGNDWKETDGLIRSSLRSDIDLLNTTNEAILEHSGKQLRPIVSLLVARACGNGKANEDSVRCAAASELLHNATLLHDDVADSSSERRGAPTVMAILGGPASVLLGDYWLVKAMVDGSAHRVLERCRVPLDDKILAVGPGLDPDILIVRLLEQR